MASIRKFPSGNYQVRDKGTSTVHPGSSAGHPAGTCERFHTDEGVLSLLVDGSALTAPKGCSAVHRTDVPHHYANEGTGWLIFAMTVEERH